MAENVESEEDLQELEVRLYSQIHHDAVSEELAPTENDKETTTARPKEVAESSNNKKDPGNGADGKKRYWATNDKSTISQHRKFIKPASDENNPSKAAASSSEIAVVDKDASAVQSLQLDTGATPPASGGGPEKKRSINPFNSKLPKIPKIRKKTTGPKDVLPEKTVDVGGNFQERKMRKLEQVKKMNQKRIKSRMSRVKHQKVVETIILVESSDEEEVIEIPVPRPPVVVLDSSGEEEEEAFAKPSDPKRAKKKKTGAGGGSRCNSPNSVMSDDFIGSQDKTRLLSETNVVEDAELLCVVGDKDDTMDAENEGGNFATPTKRVSKSRNQVQSYEVTQSNFRAIDVYESESSDMPESIYAKGKRRSQEHVSSESDVEEVSVVSKTKRLRKRMPSGSNKSSEPNDESTDSEMASNLATPLPYISRGEAVEHCKQKLKKRRTASHEGINSADKEFMNKLSNIVRGSDDKTLESDDAEFAHSADEEMAITARDIAEDALKQAGKNSEEPETEAAIPSKVIEELELLRDIDKICTTLDDYVEPPRHAGREETEVFFEDLTKNDTQPEASDVLEVKVEKSQESRKLQRAGKKDENPLDFMTVVYTNQDHVAWNEEMVRFYNFSWGQEKFNVDRILRLMNRNATWKICNADRFPRFRKHSHIKCHNCYEFGHRINNCPMPRKDLICFICGDIGHKEPRCPNTICLRCGKKTNVFTRSCPNCINENKIICPICRIRGHSIDLCPDKWRRYHSTTNVNEHPNSVVNYNETKHCCVCAGRGHLPENCRSSNKLNEYHMATTEIRYHSKTYDDIEHSDGLAPGVIGVHLMSKPNENVSFPFSKTADKDKYYGRFLEAVDMFGPPESKIVKNMVLNPFAKLANEKDSKKSAKRKKLINLSSDHIKLNVTVDVDEAEDDAAQFSPVEEDNTKPSVDETNKATPKSDNKDEIQSKTGDEPTVPIDTDSNYSFSEHFPSNEQDQKDPTLILINRKKSVGVLPDFIPISDGSMPKLKINKAKNLGPLPEFISLNNDSDDNDESKEMEYAEPDEDEECEGKIYLTNFHSQYLLSPAGTTYLIESSGRNNVKVSMDWTAVGNVLVIEGKIKNQDKFHSEVMEKMKTLSVENNRNKLEQSQKLPRSREILIKFLQESILNLEKDQGDVHEIYKKLKCNQNQYSKNSFKTAEKSRRTLNMILFGQVGLREGAMHMSVLQEKLRELQVTVTSDNVPDEFREEIETHYRYIFTSHQHNNYDQLIRQYTTLKKMNKIPKMQLDYKLLGKKVLDTKLTKEQKEKMNHLSLESSDNDNNNKIKQAPHTSFVSPKVPRTEFGGSPRKRRDNFNQQRERSFQQQQTAMAPPPPPPFKMQRNPMFNNTQMHSNQFDISQNNAPGFNAPFFNPQQTNAPRFNANNFHSPNFNQHQKNTPPYNAQFKNSPRGYQRPFNASNQNQHQQSSTNPRNTGGQSVANKIREINQRWDNRANNLLNNVSSPKSGPKSEKSASVYWSRECVKFIARSLSIRGLQQSVLDKLATLSARAANNLLSYNDFKAIKKIYFNLLKTEQPGGDSYQGQQHESMARNN